MKKGNVFLDLLHGLWLGISYVFMGWLLFVIIVFLAGMAGCAHGAERPLGHVKFVNKHVLPLEVCADARLSDRHFTALQNAIEAWNDALGMDFFEGGCRTYRASTARYGHTSPPYHEQHEVIVMLARDDDLAKYMSEGTRGVAQNYGYFPNSVRSVVWLSETLEGPVLFNVAAHELGHVLGLGHNGKFAEGKRLMFFSVSTEKTLLPTKELAQEVRRIWRIDHEPPRTGP